MRKVGFLAVFWTLVLAIPFIALALSAVAYTTDHLSEIINSITSFSLSTTASGRGWILEFAQR
jgi:hypothetical protein